MLSLRRLERAFHFCCLPLSNVFFILVFLSVISLLVTVHYIQPPVTLLDDEAAPDRLPRKGFVVDTPGCQIPDLDPFDKSIRHLIIKTHAIVCNVSGPPITYIDGDWLRINFTALDLHYDDKLDHCHYQEILRPKPFETNPDNTYTYNRTLVTFDTDIKMTCSFIRLACYGRRGDMIYSNFHAFILKNEKREREYDQRFKTFHEKSNPKEAMNVLALGVDAMSRLNFMRQMPNTRRYIIKTLKAAELKGMNKVADNTFVNLVPIFAGKFVEELPWDEMKSAVPFDNYTFLWNSFSMHGYRTLFAEDAPLISTFNYIKEGFHKEPTDYYLRPFSLALEEHGSLWDHNRICVGSKQETEIVLDYLKLFLSTFKDKPFYAVSFITRLTHDNLNRAGVGDDLYYEFFKWMHDNRFLNNTAIIFFSDHGIRFGPIRETYTGKLEERLPFGYVIMPTWFPTRYPSLWNNLRENQNKLTTPFDYFEMMKDILNFNGKESIYSVNDRGISLFSHIPASRTCEHAGILPHWCTCHQKQPISTEDTTVKEATKAAIDHINGKLQHKVSPCAVLKLLRIMDALKLLSNEHVLSFKQSLHDVIGREVTYGDKAKAVVDYLVTFQVNPGNGMFEATVRHSTLDGSFEVIGDISRINAYGNSGHCMPNFSLQKFCHCL